MRKFTKLKRWKLKSRTDSDTSSDYTYKDIVKVLKRMGHGVTENWLKTVFNGHASPGKKLALSLHELTGVDLGSILRGE